MKYGMKLFFVFCLSGMLSGSLLPTNIYAQEEIQTENENGDEESSESKSELPKSSYTAPVYHFSLDKFLTKDEIETAELKSENPNIRSRVTFADIMYEATKYEGLPYVWGGRYPSQGGFDCAGLCMYVYNKICGTSFDLINTNAAMLYTNHCTPVSESDAQPGDLVFFKGTYEAIDYISHVGIYCGNGIMFNAGDPIGYGYVHDVKNMYGGKAEVLFGRVNNVDVVVSCQSGFNNINGNWYYYDENGNLFNEGHRFFLVKMHLKYSGKTTSKIQFTSPIICKYPDGTYYSLGLLGFIDRALSENSTCHLTLNPDDEFDAWFLYEASRYSHDKTYYLRGSFQNYIDDDSYTGYLVELNDIEDVE